MMRWMLCLLLLVWPSHLLYGEQERDLRARLAEARHKWQEGRPSAYEFTIEIRCFCMGIAKTPPAFRVAQGEARAVTELTADSQKLYESFNTVEKLFAAIDRSLSRGQYKSTLKYDEQLGFPVVAELDPQRWVKDEELYFRVTGFRVITP